MVTRPTQVGDFEGLYSVEVSPFAKQISQQLVDDGYFFFTSNQQILDAFGASFDRATTQQAIDNLITFTKALKKMRCEMLRFGFLLDKETNSVSLTYTIQSSRYNNQPLEVKDVFKLDFPLLSLINHFAQIWNNSYKNRPQIEIIKVSNGK